MMSPAYISKKKYTCELYKHFSDKYIILFQHHKQSNRRRTDPVVTTSTIFENILNEMRELNNVSALSATKQIYSKPATVSHCYKSPLILKCDFFSVLRLRAHSHLISTICAYVFLMKLVCNTLQDCHST